MANCENCIKADVCKHYEPKSTIACKHYAEAAKHGHWEYGEERNGSVYAYCTACHRKMNFNCYGYPHCPLCGASLGGKQE